MTISGIFTDSLIPPSFQTDTRSTLLTLYYHLSTDTPSVLLYYYPDLYIAVALGVEYRLVVAYFSLNI